MSRATALAALSLLVCLTACGKAGRPVAPPDSTYPQIYPNPALGPSAARQSPGRAEPPGWDQEDLKARFTKAGTYRDPAVEATQLGTGSRVLPGSNLPNAQTTTPDSPLDRGFGAPSQSPLPPLSPAPGAADTEGQ
ncbi:MAG TPA: hypothetical protein HPQ04_14955 [Rhodospirillaceae bacterium]|nr:hypothetical protein [Rhodospirillaceae bacterium]